MAELKRTFQTGRMQRDVDDRLVPNGEYREGLNVNIGKSESSDIGAVENLFGNEAQTAIGEEGAVTIGKFRENGGDRLYFFSTTNNSDDLSQSGNHFIHEYEQRTGNVNLLASGEWLDFHQQFTITGINFIDSLLYWTDDRSQPRKINVDRARVDPTYYDSDVLAAVAKFAPFTPPAITDTTTSRDTGVGAVTSNFLQDKLPRFAYRFQFDDGEYSTISPFTPICFLPPTHGDIDATTRAVFNVNTVRAGELNGLINDLKTITLQIVVPTGLGIIKTELIYKETTNTNIYVIDEQDFDEEVPTITFDYRSQDPFRTLPENQLTRVYDAVPRLAKSQEIAGSRIVYGNYLQNRNIPSLSFSVSAVSTGTLGHPRFIGYSVKSRRTYQVGIILSDEYGRQTPVILSSSGNDTVFVNAIAQTEGDLRQKLQITFNTAPPSWAHSYRIVVKQREQEYYNVFSQIGTTTIDSFNYRTVGRFGDSINKIPIDQTLQSDAGGLVAPTSTSVYPTIAGGIDIQDSGLVKVQGIINAGGQAIVPDISGTDGDAVVYETEPTISDIDIFFETSTGGLTSTINPIDPTPVDIDFWNCTLVELYATALETNELGTIEVNRLRAGYNEPFFDVGVRAYQVQENFAEERRSNALIHSSGFFNSRTNLNQLNQFNEAEGGLTISLDPADGSIQKLYAEDTQIIIWQEDKVSRSPIDKDFIYSAEGGAIPVTSNSQYLGTIAPYAGEYGISKDPGSFAVYGMNKFFTDRNRGVVLRLGQNGLTEISRSGMVDFFRDALFGANKITGSFDEYQNSYNLTILGEGYTTQIDTNIATAADNYFTLGWEENASGWVSFKTFDQEGGTTLNNRYYTFKGGEVWLHNSPNVPRNTFYKTQVEIDAPGFTPDPSYIDFIFNDSPSVIKEFKTLSLEGSNGWACEYVQTDIETVGEIDVIDNGVTITITNENSLPNTIFTGIRSQIGIPAVNATLNWTIIAESSDVTRLFTLGSQATIVDPEITGLTITGEAPLRDDTIPGRVTPGRGTLSWEVVYEIENVTEDVTIPLTFEGAGPVPRTIGHVIILTVDNTPSIPNMTFVPALVLLGDTDFGGNGLLNNPLTFTANANTNIADIQERSYFFESDPDDNTLPIPGSGNNAQLTIDYSELNDLIPGTPNEITYRLDPDNLNSLQTTFTLMRPDVEVRPVISVTGAGPAEYPEVIWNLEDFFQENVTVREVFSYPGATSLVLPDHMLGGNGQDQSTITYINPRQRSRNELVFEPITTHTFVENRGTFNIIANPPSSVFTNDNINESFPEDGTWEVVLTPELIETSVAINYDIGGAAVPVDFVNGANVTLPFAVAASTAISYTANVRSDAFVGVLATSTLTDTKPTFVNLIGTPGNNSEVEVLRSGEVVPTVEISVDVTTTNLDVDSSDNPQERSFFVRAQRSDFSAPLPLYTPSGNVLFMEITQPILSQTLTYTNPRGGTASNYASNIDLTDTNATDVNTQVTRWQVVGGVPTESVGFGRTNANFIPNFNLAGGTITFTIATTYEWRATLSFPGDSNVLIENTGNNYDNQFINNNYTGNHLELEHGTSGRIRTFDSTVTDPITTFQLHCRNESNLGPGDKSGSGNSDFVNMALLTIQSLGGLNEDNRRVGSLLLYINQQAIP